LFFKIIRIIIQINVIILGVKLFENMIVDKKLYWQGDSYKD